MTRKPTYEELEERVRTLESGTALQQHLKSSLQQSEYLYYLCFRLNPNPVTITTFPEGRFVDVNDSFVDTFGYSREELIGRTAAEMDLWVDPDQREQLLRDIDAAEKAWIPGLHVRTKSGDILKVIFSAAGIEISRKRYLISTAYAS